MYSAQSHDARCAIQNDDVERFARAFTHLEQIGSHDLYEGIVKLSLRYICSSGGPRCLEWLLSHAEHSRHIHRFGKQAEAFPIVAIASEHGNIAVVETLLRHGFDVTVSGERRGSPLEIACMKKNTELCELLLDEIATIHGALAETCDKMADYCQRLEGCMYMAMCCACEKGYVDIVEMFIKYKVDVNLNLDEYIGTPLHCAAESGCVELVSVLLEAGADVELLRECYLQTPLARACEYGRVEIVKLLLEAGAEINRQTRKCSTALTVACHYGEVDVAVYLIDQKADPLLHNEWGYTALYMSVDSPLLLKRLLRENVLVNERCGERDEAPLHLAAVVGNIDSVRMLTDHEADIDILTRYEETSLWLATWKGHFEVAKHLILLNCSTNVPSNGCEVYKWKYTPMEIAISTDQTELVDLLHKAGCGFMNPIYFGEQMDKCYSGGHGLKIRKEIIDYAQANGTLGDLVYRNNNPRMLRLLTVINIRHSLPKGIAFVGAVEKLGLPNMLKRLILLQ